MSDAEPLRPSSAPQLNGWKEIAAHLGKSVRSVQRWEMTLGLPVHRIRTPDGVIIYADAAEIEAWKRGLDAPRVLAEDGNGLADPANLEASLPADVIERKLFSKLRYWLLAAAGVLFAVLGYAAGRLTDGQAGWPSR